MRTPGDTSITKPTSNVWECISPMDGYCGVKHTSERTALDHSKRIARTSGHWSLPHRLDCAEAIRGTNYPCNCGAYERNRQAKEQIN